MFRTTVLAVALSLVGCHREPRPMTPKEGELPPLPPASGTPVGYLLDSAATLKLREDQVEELKKLDASLAARNDAIDTQLREIEKPAEEPPPEKPKPGDPPPKPKNWAPGMSPVHTTNDANKLREAKAANNKDALQKAFALLDAEQQVTARRLLDERGITAPGGGAAQPAPRSEDDSGGVPLEP
ncbi:MAG: hypothetical protein JNL83_13610 [Myxococcales bacterium]|nr:hypothetical protein [Myxococcales bacterium]